jgi:hypothetical protein
MHGKAARARPGRFVESILILRLGHAGKSSSLPASKEKKTLTNGLGQPMLAARARRDRLDQPSCSVETRPWRLSQSTHKADIDTIGVCHVGGISVRDEIPRRFLPLIKVQCGVRCIDAQPYDGQTKMKHAGLGDDHNSGPRLQLVNAKSVVYSAVSTAYACWVRQEYIPTLFLGRGHKPNIQGFSSGASSGEKGSQISDPGQRH